MFSVMKSPIFILILALLSYSGSTKGQNVERKIPGDKKTIIFQFPSETHSITEVSYYSCKGRCNEAYNRDYPCQCNAECQKYDNCCSDYETFCKGPTTDDVIELSEELYRIDVNNVGKFIKYDTSLPGPLFLEVDNEALDRPTISAFLDLIDNYYHFTEYAEVDTSQELEERSRFLDLIMSTSVMTRTEEFLKRYNLIDKALRNVIEELFFTYYPREQRTLGSSGFEHSFMGELDDGKVKGFHNWLTFYRNEENGTLFYRDFFDEHMLADNITLLEVGFEWYQLEKHLTSMLIGSSPEFELALYTVCFHTSRNSKCPVSTNGHKYWIQTWSQEYEGNTYVGTAYPLA